MASSKASKTGLKRKQTSDIAVQLETNGAHQADGDMPAQLRLWQDLTVTAQDGLALHARLYGGQPHVDNPLPPVICLPGLTRNARDFHDLAVYLSETASPTRQVVAIDYRGRGDSGRDSQWQNYTIEQEARDLLTVLTRLNVEHADFIGTSRGGLIILALTAMRPGILRKIVLNDIGPVIEPRGLARIKSYAGSMTRYKNFEQAAGEMQLVHGAQFPALTAQDWLKMAHQIFRQMKKGVEPDYDKGLLNSLHLIDFTQPLPTAWPQFDALKTNPLLCIRGANSDILTEETLDQMRQVHPDMTVHIVDDQGHAPLLWDEATQKSIATHCAD